MILPKLLAAVLQPASAAEPAAGAVDKTVTLHVAQGGDDRWSGRLATPAADGSDGPLWQCSWCSSRRGSSAASSERRRHMPVKTVLHKQYLRVSLRS